MLFLFSLSLGFISLFTYFNTFVIFCSRWSTLYLQIVYFLIVSGILLLIDSILFASCHTSRANTGLDYFTTGYMSNFVLLHMHRMQNSNVWSRWDIYTILVMNVDDFCESPLPFILAFNVNLEVKWVRYNVKSQLNFTHSEYYF